MSSSDTLRAVQAPVHAVAEAQRQIRDEVHRVLAQCTDLELPPDAIDKAADLIAQAARKALLSLTWTAYAAGIKRGNQSP